MTTRQRISSQLPLNPTFLPDSSPKTGSNKTFRSPVTVTSMNNPVPRTRRKKKLISPHGKEKSKSNNAHLVSESVCFDRCQSTLSTTISNDVNAHNKENVSFRSESKLSSNLTVSSQEMNLPKLRETNQSMDISYASLLLSNEAAGSPLPSLIRIQTISNASWSFPDFNANISEELHLEEHYVEIINVARRCLQAVTAKNSHGMTQELQLANLHVATNCLRSVTPIVVSLHRSNDNILVAIDRIMKLFFHTIATCETISVDISNRLQGESDASTQIISFQSFLSSAIVAVAAYQGLGFLLRSILAVPWIKHQRKDLSALTTSILEMFPLPDLMTFFDCNRTKTEHYLSHANVVIAVRSILSICAILKKWHLIALKYEPSGNARNLLLQSQLIEMKSLEDFGPRLFQNFLLWIDFDVERKRLAPFQRILSCVGMTWIIALSNCDDASGGGSIVEEIAGYSKKSSKLIWDIADDCNSVLSNISIDILRLNAKEDAIMIFMLYRQDFEGNWIVHDSQCTSGIHLSRMTVSLENACVFASRSSAAYFQTQDSSYENVLLFQFHGTVGSAIDKQALEERIPSQGYIEYSATRAIHLSKYYESTKLISCQCVLSHFPFPFYHSVENCIRRNDSKLSWSHSITIFFLALSVRDRIYNINQTLVASEIISDFVFFLQFDNICNDDVSMKIFQLTAKMLDTLDLYRNSYQILNTLPSDVNCDAYFRLQVMSSILGDIYAPINFILALSNAEDSRNDKVSLSHDNVDSCFFLGVDLLLRAIFLEDKLKDSNQVSTSSLPLKKSAYYIQLILKKLTGIKMKQSNKYISACESVGKSLWHLGKKRMGRKEDTTCLTLLIAALELLGVAFNFTRSCDYKLSHRYAYLSTLFQSLGSEVGAILSIAMSIRYIIHEAYIQCDLDQNPKLLPYSEVLLFCDDHVMESPTCFSHRWSQCFSDRCQALVSKIVEIWNNSSTGCNPRYLPDIGIEGEIISIQKISHRPNGVLSLSDVIAAGIFVPLDSCEIGIGADVVKAILCMLASSVDFTDTVRKEFYDILNQSISLVEKSVSYNGAQNLIVVELYVTAAASLYCHECCREDARSLCQSAVQRLQQLKLMTTPIMLIILDVYQYSVQFTIEHMFDEEHEFFLEKSKQPVMNDGVLSIRSIPHVPPCYENLVRSCAQCLIEIRDVESAIVPVRLVEGLFSLILKAHRKLEFFGCAASIPEATTNLICEKNKESAVWIHSYVSNLLGGDLYSEVEDLLIRIGGGDLIQESQRAISTNYATLIEIDSAFRSDESSIIIDDVLRTASEILLYSINIESLSLLLDPMLVSKLTMHITQFSDSLSNLLSGVNNAISRGDDSKTILWLACHCSLISIYAGLYNCYDRVGNLNGACKNLRLCCQCSQNLLLYLERNISSCDSRLLKRCAILMHPSTLIVQTAGRVADCFSRMARIYSQLGDSGKSCRYSLWSMETLGIVPKNSSVSRYLSLMNLTVKPLTFRQTRYLRSCIETFLLASPYSAANDEMYALVQLGLRSTDLLMKGDMFSLNSPVIWDWFREAVRDLIMFGDAFERNLTAGEKGMQLCYNHAQLFCGIHIDDGTVACYESQDPEIIFRETKLGQIMDKFCQAHHRNSLDSVFCEMILRVAQQFYKQDTDESKNTALSIFHCVSRAMSASSVSRAKALYYLGGAALEAARKKHELAYLWKGHSYGADETDSEMPLCHDDSNIVNAKLLFRSASKFSGPASTPLSRNILRSLALVTGPESSSSYGYSAGELVHSSIGCSARLCVLRAYEQALQKNDFFSDADVMPLFSAFDSPLHEEEARKAAFRGLYKVGSMVIPENMKFIAIALCPSGETLISVLERSPLKTDSSFVSRTVCIFPDKPESIWTNVLQVVEDIWTPFNKVMEHSRRQLSKSRDLTHHEESYSDDQMKLQWWEERRRLDSMLKSLLDDVENRFFKHACVHDILSSKITDNCHPSTNCLSSDIQSLGSKHEAAALESLDNSLDVELLNRYTVNQLKEKLRKRKDFSQSALRGLRKAELIKLLIDCASSESVSMSRSDCHLSHYPNMSFEEERKKSCEDIFVLVLDENLQNFPFENIPTFAGRTVCRLPSLPFAISRYCKSGIASQPYIDPMRTCYVIDPESNLTGTRQRMETFLAALSNENNWEWSGTAGEIPSDSFLESAIRKENGLYLYCGHGGGEKFLPRSKISKLISGEKATSECKAASKEFFGCKTSVVLMGCSSGKMASVNSAIGECVPTQRLYFEPEGTVISYLCAGAPCIVANLWDVTDRDIDRYFQAMLQSFMSSGSCDTKISLATCVAQARSSCKLKYIVGCAPVIYGIPLHLQ